MQVLWYNPVMSRKTISSELENTSIIHLHTDLGSPDGAGKISDYIECFKEKGVDYATITDHGDISAIYQWYVKCKKAGITPGIGCEYYINNNRSEKNVVDGEDDRSEDNTNPDDAANDHLVAVAKNQNGIYNIIKLHNEAVFNGFYRKPRTTFEKLFDMADDIMISTACLAGFIPRLILKDRHEDAKKVMAAFKERFGDDFYAEVHINQIDVQKKVNASLINMANELGVKIIVAQDCHYVNYGDNILRMIKMLDKRGTTIDDIQKNGMPPYLMWLSEETLYVKDNKEIFDRAVEWGHKELPKNDLVKYLINNNEWKYKTDVRWEFSTKRYNKYTDFDQTKYSNVNEYFGSMVSDEFNKFLKCNLVPADKRDEYQKRIDFEMNVLINNQYVDYLLETRESIKKVEEQFGEDNVGVGRGSVGGSLIAYILGITKIDPIKHELLFERFLNDARSSEILEIDI